MSTSSNTPDHPGETLTPRQREIAALVAKGLTNDEIAAALGIVAGTVKVHLSAIYRTLDVTNRTEVAGLWAAQAARDAERPTSDRGGAEGPRVVVLPLGASSSDLQDRYVSEGVSDDLTTMLARIPGLTVIGRGTARSFSARAPSPSGLRKSLGVSWVVEGSARVVGERVRINLGLTDAESGVVHWAEYWDRPLAALTNAQDDALEEIAATVATQILFVDARRHGRVVASNLEAWIAYHRAVVAFYFRGLTKAASSEALALLDLSLSKDPDFAYAHGLRATVLSGRFLLGWSDDPGGDAGRVSRAGERAIEIAPEDPLVLQHWGYALSILEGPVRAVPVLEEAIARDPNNAQAHADLGYFLCTSGYADEGEARVDRALALSPIDPRRYSWLSYRVVGALARRDYEEALVRTQTSIDLFDRFPMTLGAMAVLHRRLGNRAESDDWGARARAIHPAMSFRSVGDWMDGVAAAGDRVQARTVRLGFDPRSPD